ncbi:MAG: bifunctional 5,10-methylenetetrahydrofolate dehydrogenase/5,10-methenyltetrahydrofolate cyclohydrolase [Rhodospirillaceae bacterium]|nr:bifunctional 5,10-methylenetetrahydrofolate dehydrogenase/5,10-methenyltetrahydrofolate cyclohydrolase [Rhodospirillaceae bacterium]MBL6930565.1 bifunctional 5,10-methylenetetrahydrofolate dehydrogenase/5,10-methenyltetrahydrofolate cyclohydrolase [Rhodospirillales bacterium]MBL6941671.1 bifunctional 5,10-methylenetetrahydrofolate dehydrogenase/5,10-methenyltetrahydrofolate cyclohydrolase [Rhodospirillales bacterium]
MHKIIDGKLLAREILEEVSDSVADLASAGWQPKLVAIVIGDSAPVALYVRNQKRTSENAGIEFEERAFSGESTEDEILAAIASMNADPRITGIILQRPVPDHMNMRRLQSAVHPLKDVEGMHPSSIGDIVYNDIRLGPCTAMASVELLKQTGLTLEGLEVTVIGHSEIVGKPIAFLLMAEGATVTVCHHMTRNLAVHSRRSDAVFVAVGKAALISGDMIKPGAAVIDIGINQVTDEDGNTEVVGDADYESCEKVAGWITPVPGGVGPVTVAILMRNSVIAASRQKEHYEARFGTIPMGDTTLRIAKSAMK